MKQVNKIGFTLIELSIVLVIIGLIVGGVLVGRDLISAAAVRSQITQIDQYNTAVYIFRGKYNCLPGDCASAAQFNFPAPASCRGEGDGDGQLVGGNPNCNAIMPGQQYGETVFWVELSKAGLIPNEFNVASFTTYFNVTTTSSPYKVSDFLPPAKIGRGNYVYVYSGGPGGVFADDRLNYFGVSAVSSIQNGYIDSLPAFTVAEAFVIDTKVDDGLPQAGKITALYYTHTICENGCGTTGTWAAGLSNFGANSGWSSYGPTDAATTGSSTTCYDNSSNGGVGVNGATQHYSTE